MRGSRLAASMLAVALVGGGLVARAVASDSADVPALHVVAGTGSVRTVELLGLNDAALRQLGLRERTMREWQEAFALFLDDSTIPDVERHAVVAQYDIEGGRVRLTPRFPLTPGVSYRTRVAPAPLARLTGGNGPQWTAPEERFTIPKEALDRTTRVLGVYPALTRVPANLLRWYVEFSAPMESGSALEHVRLLDASGREVPGAFLTVEEELWSPDRRRLTLLFDPGRVKRGIRTNLQSGAPLREGRRYRLAIDADWHDGRGASLVSGFEHLFEVAPDDRSSPDPGRWRLTPPTAGTREPLRVDLTEPLDHALLAHTLVVVDKTGRVVPGWGLAGEGDSTWSFVPQAPWSRGPFELRAQATLEDLAGNSIERVFDADLQGRTPSPRAPVTAVSFAVR